MRKRLLPILLTLLLMSACSAPETPAAEMEGAVSSASEPGVGPARTGLPGIEPREDAPAEDTGGEAPSEEELCQLPLAPLTGAPELYLAWSGGGTKLSPSSYEWTYPEGEEMVSVVACGLAPADAAEYLEPIALPGEVQATLDNDGIQLPQQITVRRWDGDTAETVYTGGIEGVFALEPGATYEITAVWSEEYLEGAGFCGEGSYIFHTAEA